MAGLGSSREQFRFNQCPEIIAVTVRIIWLSRVSGNIDNAGGTLSQYV